MNNLLHHDDVKSVPLGNLCEFTQGVQIPASETYREHGPGLIRYLYIRDFFTDKYQVFVKDIYPKKVLESSEIIMVNTGNTAGDVYRGKVGVLCNNAFKIHIKKETSRLLDSDYLWHFLNSEQKDRLLKRLFNSAGQPHVGHNNVAKLKIPLFEIREQRRIAEVLGEWDNAITLTERLIEAKQRRKKSLMQQLLTGKTRFGEFVGSEWQKTKLGEVATFLDGKRRPIKEADRANMRGKYPYYGASGIIDYVNDYLFDEDLVLLGEDGENILSRNLPLAFKVSGKIWVNNHAHVIKPHPNMDVGFLAEYLESLSYVRYNSGTAQPKLNKSTCLKIDVVVPSLPEQRRIAAVLQACDVEIETLGRKLSALKAQKKGLMQVLLSGRVRV